MFRILPILIPQLASSVQFRKFFKKKKEKQIKMREMEGVKKFKNITIENIY